MDEVRGVAALYRRMQQALVAEGFAEDEATALTPSAVSVYLPKQGGSRPRSRAEEWLTSFLREHGPTESSAVKEAATQEAIASATLQRARGKAGVVISPTGNGKETVWSLPEYRDVSLSVDDSDSETKVEPHDVFVFVSEDETDTKEEPIVSPQPETEMMPPKRVKSSKLRIRRTETTETVEPEFAGAGDSNTIPASQLELMSLKDLRLQAKTEGVPADDIRGADSDTLVEQIILHRLRGDDDDDLNSLDFEV